MRASFSLLCLLAACAHMPGPVPFQWVARKIMVLPVQVGGVNAPFILDTGAGLTLVDDKLCEEVKCKVVGAYTSRKASGQPFTVPLAAVSSLCLGAYCQKDMLVGLLPLGEVRGLLSLKFFAQTAFTLDYKRAELRVGEVVQGDATVLRLDEDGPSLLAFMPFALPNGQAIMAEVDTSADALVLDTRLMKLLAVDESTPSVRTVFGKDSTGSQFIRYFTTLDIGGQSNVEVIFQSIIYSGLVGQAFLRAHTITFDLPHSRMIFARP